MNTHSPTKVAEESGLAQVVHRNIEALLEQRRNQENQRSLEDRIADTITRFTGSMIFVYVHLIFFGLWITINLGLLPIKKFDPSFVVLAMSASVEAIFLSTFVLISQNRMAVMADQRANLDLHISLLAEHEITHLIKLVTAMAARMDLEESKNPELKELAQDVQPDRVMEDMASHEERFQEART